MAFRWIVSRIIRLFGQKTNSLFYTLVYRELQQEIVKLAEKINMSPDELSKEIGRRAAAESAERHASVLGLVPINPNNPKKIQKYIETLWFILFGQNMKDYEIEVDDTTEGRQRVTFYLKHCPVCMGHEDDEERYKTLYNMFSGEETEGYACLMAGMLEKLAEIIMEHKGLDIRMDIKETKCFARGDEIMAVEAQVVPVDEYNQRAPVDIGIATRVEPDVQKSTMEGIAEQSSRLFEQFADKLQLDQIDSFFEEPVDQIKEKLSETVEKELHFTPKDILQYFENYEEDIFRVVGYLSIHALNELGGIVSNIASTYLLSKLMDILISAFEYGLETYIPDKIVEDNKKMIVEMMEGWANEKSISRMDAFEPRDMLKYTLEGVKLALMDYGAEFVGAKEATWTLLQRSSLLNEDEPSKTFNLLFDIFQEAALVGGFLLAIPIKMLLSGEYEVIKTPITSVQEVYQSSREHVERLFDLIEELQEIDFAVEEDKYKASISKAFPKMV